MSSHSPSIDLSTQTPGQVSGGVLVLAVGTAGRGGKDASALVVHGTGTGTLPKKAESRILAAAEAVGFTGGAEEFARIPAVDGLKAPSLALVGVGSLDPADLTGQEPHRALESLRRAAGRVLRGLNGKNGGAHVVLGLPAPTPAALTALAEGAWLGAYAFTRHKASELSSPAVPAERVEILAAKRSSENKKALARAASVAAAVNRARDLVNESPNHLYPELFAQEVKAQGSDHKVKVTVYDDAYLRKNGFGGLIGVGQGSARPPRLVKVEYSGGARRAKHLAIVGKGITFDSGGISLKPAAGMEDMKSDMAGAAAAVQAVFAIADLGLPVKATAWLALAENMPSGAAQRPSDIISIYGGRTVEVLNTDAEGRLVMADALALASEDKPDLLLDVATLTGAQVIALGNRVSAVMGADAAREAVVAAAERAGEQVWPMPLPEELLPTLKSQAADLANVGKRPAGMLSAGVFLQQFVGDKDGKQTNDDDARIDWAHIDIAGPAYNGESAWGYTVPKGTGVAVRTLVAVAEHLA
ncbi:leucyl aminopeptidase [Sediminivirga luteola]|uniref:Probable cytosol aminopeptidase n=1 Tax=Sediminivirga luteola TaxID=1774748 RepID=A0A8J2XJW3_9MICO|nr:leucyl aminopeptidase [Sediminivirga luteola]MCI2264006.1 leucyl aminopeptidase [Sediminivirga luteola]GGA23080.1 putative cytosol aminopeptidase [Sediminivirga luteola]